MDYTPPEVIASFDASELIAEAVGQGSESQQGTVTFGIN